MLQDGHAQNNLTTQINQLVLTIRALMANYPNGWMPWPVVSTQIFGTASFVAVLQGYVALPQYNLWFSSNQQVVRLTASGVQYPQTLQPVQLNEVQRIALGVTHYAARLTPIHLRIQDISQVAHVDTKFIHTVLVESADEIIPSETPVRFQSLDGGGATYGKIVGQEPDAGIFYVAFSTRIFQAALPANLVIDQGYLLYQLAQRIGSLQALPERIAPIFHDAPYNGISIAHQDPIEVSKKLANLAIPWTRFLWGPPGAGKTYALGDIIIRLLQSEPDERILLVAASNRAVDVAVEQLIGQLGTNALQNLISERKILRFGYPRKKKVVEHPELLGPEDLDDLNEQAKGFSERIALAEQNRVADSEMARLRAELLGIQEKVKSRVDAHIRQSCVVATTNTLAYLTESIANEHWDTVLIDEVTMVTPAMCTFLAALAVKRFLLAGDPRQLGPVYKRANNASVEDREWMGRDVFDKSGVSHGEGINREINRNDHRLTRITSQRRCGTNIWSRVEPLYRQVANLTNDESLEYILALPPKAGQSVVLLDTSNNNGLARCESFHRSWRNNYSAELAMQVAYTAAAFAERPASIAIISPYRAQVQLLRKWIRHELHAERSPYMQMEIEAGTVHQFQGSDADMVIFDLVDGVGRHGLGELLKGDTGIRLVNVAITRAKGKFVIVADKTWFGQRCTEDQNPLLWNLVMEQNARGVIRVAPPANIENPQTRVQTESPIEKILYEAMLGHPDLKDVSLQYIIRDDKATPISRADFAFPDLYYAIYCDGAQWHLTRDKWQKDWRQRNKLTELGWSFSVFTGHEINKNREECVSQIAKTYRARRLSMNQ